VFWSAHLFFSTIYKVSIDIPILQTTKQKSAVKVTHLVKDGAGIQYPLIYSIGNSISLPESQWARRALTDTKHGQYWIACW
jgi:hypothetical protein